MYGLRPVKIISINNNKASLSSLHNTPAMTLRQEMLQVLYGTDNPTLATIHINTVAATAAKLRLSIRAVNTMTTRHFLGIGEEADSTIKRGNSRAEQNQRRQDLIRNQAAAVRYATSDFFLQTKAASSLAERCALLENLFPGTNLTPVASGSTMQREASERKS